MDSPRFFCPPPLTLGGVVDLPANAARHAARVLRLAAGDALTLFDGQGTEYPARIVRVHKDAVSVEVFEPRAYPADYRESPLKLTLAQALQAGDKMDFTVQKAVELGCATIQPLAARRSVVRLDAERALKRVEHWQAVAASACEQCGRNHVPLVAGLLSLTSWLATLGPALPGEARLMLAPDADAYLDTLPAPSHVILLIGPEGGFDPQEVAAAKAAGFTGIRLGPRILRTETAGLAALAALQMIWGDFGGNGHV